MKKENGIALITLIITIVVMLILASIALYATLSDGGIFDVTHDSIDETTNKTEIEELHVIVEQCLNDSMIKGYGSYITDKALYTAIREVVGYSDETGLLRNVKTTKTSEGDYLITFLDTKRQYSISKEGEISEDFTVIDKTDSVIDIFEGIKNADEIE